MSVENVHPDVGHAAQPLAQGTEHAAEHVAEGHSKAEAFQHFLQHHVMDGTEWHLPFLHISLPSFLTLHSVMLILAVVFLYLLFGVFFKKGQRVPTGLTNFLESFVVFIRDEIAIANLGERDGRKFAPFFCSLFFFILMLNFMGLIPLFSTATSNIAVTTALSLVILGFIIIGGIARNGFIGYLKSFAPPGIPGPVLVILVPIEILGVFIKAFALTVRLFANMLAGHIVLFSLLGMILLFGVFVAPPVVLMATGIYLLEIFVALLQAYIFTLLAAMFIGTSLHPEH